MGFDVNENMVRVDLWKPSGKWKYTISLKWYPFSSKIESIHEIFRRCMNEQYPGKFEGLRATCLEPYCEYSHPISIIIGEENETN